MATKEDGARKKRIRKRADRYDILNYYIIIAMLGGVLLLLFLILCF